MVTAVISGLQKLDMADSLAAFNSEQRNTNKGPKTCTSMDLQDETCLASEKILTVSGEAQQITFFLVSVRAVFNSLQYLVFAFKEERKEQFSVFVFLLLSR